MPAPIDATMISRFSTLALRTGLGDIDVVLRPAGIEDYSHLRANAVAQEVVGIEVLDADTHPHHDLLDQAEDVTTH